MGDAHRASAAATIALTSKQLLRRSLEFKPSYWGQIELTRPLLQVQSFFAYG